MLHTHRIVRDDNLAPSEPINCAIRDREELTSECLELHLGEELHAGNGRGSDMPLLRYDMEGLKLWLATPPIWFPLGQRRAYLCLDGDMPIVKVRQPKTK